MSYQLSEINGRIRSDPAAFVAECDLRFESAMTRAAEKLCDNLNKSHIALLSGPSSSGKTTSAQKLEEKLQLRGVHSHVVSLDNYFLTVDPETTPKTPDGNFDFESPACLNLPLFHSHFEKLANGDAIRIPRFDFNTRRLIPDGGEFLKLGKGEIVIFEGIHALNDMITGSHPESIKLFVSAESDVILDDNTVFSGSRNRFLRRLVRDYKFRNTAADRTIGMWDNVLRGEKLYIRPFVQGADMFIDTAHGYDVSVLKNFAVPLLEALPRNNPLFEEYLHLTEILKLFEPLDESLIRPEALLREFIGGGTYVY